MMRRLIEARTRTVCVQIDEICNVFRLGDGEMKCEHIIGMIGTSKLLLGNESEVFTVECGDFGDGVG